jgi:hypothetical protein
MRDRTRHRTAYPLRIGGFPRGSGARECHREPGPNGEAALSPRPGLQGAAEGFRALAHPVQSGAGAVAERGGIGRCVVDDFDQQVTSHTICTSYRPRSTSAEQEP